MGLVVLCKDLNKSRTDDNLNEHRIRILEFRDDLT